MIKFKHNIGSLNNKLNSININNIELYFSYDSLIAIEYNNFLLIDSYYKNYSVTTNKHLSYIKHYDDYYNIYVNYNLFDQITKDNINIDLIESIIKEYKNKYYSLEYIKEFKDNIKYKNINSNNFYDSFINLNNHIELLNNKRLELIKDQIKALKTVTKHYLTYKINNIEFIIIKTYSNNKNKTLKNIKFKGLKVDPIKIF